MEPEAVPVSWVEPINTDLMNSQKEKKRQICAKLHEFYLINPTNIYPVIWSSHKSVYYLKSTIYLRN